MREERRDTGPNHLVLLDASLGVNDICLTSSTGALCHKHTACTYCFRQQAQVLGIKQMSLAQRIDIK